MEIEKLYDYCKNWAPETSDSGYQTLLYHFPKTAITENKKVAAKVEPPSTELPMSQLREQEVQTKETKILLAERKCEMAEKKYEELKERVKKDIQQIRLHEKELEARLEILKRDSETLLAAKDKKLLEFKRKIDSLEYEMESLVEKEKAAHKKVEVLKERMNRVLRALKLGASLLESEEDLEQEISKSTEASQATQPSLTATKKSKIA